MTSTLKDKETQLLTWIKKPRRWDLEFTKEKPGKFYFVTDEKIIIEDQEIEKVVEYKYQGQT